jgi:hypothetical protein
VRDYAKLAPKFWTGATCKALRRCGPEALIVAVYLVSSPASNMLGLYYQPMLYMAHETGLGLEGASKGLRSCVEHGFCSYDDGTEMVFVHEMAAWQIAKSLAPKDKRCKGIQRDYNTLPDCPHLGAFFDRYAVAFHLTGRRGSGGPCPVDKPVGPQAPSKPLRSQEQEQEQEQRVTLCGDIAPARMCEADDEPQGHAPTPGGAACKAIRLSGIHDVNPSHPDLLRLLAAGVTAQELADAAVVLVGKGKASFAYLLRTVEGQRRDAAAKAAVPIADRPGPTTASDAAERTAELLRQQANRGHTAPPAALLARRRATQETSA